MAKREDEGRLERVVYKTVPSVEEAGQLGRELQRKGYNPRFTDAKFISGNEEGYDVYAVSAKRTPKGFRAKRIRMVGIIGD
ncbi:MAG: hypothetical protein NT076_02020 [Candidatus Pacearchaeota archaeon]|nr:hypothetical protein [Candidatus Pacearchaeota archaeon]